MDQDKVKQFDEIVAANGNFERKGKSVPYTSANGHMFAFINKENQFGIRLPKARQKEFLVQFESGPFLSHGAVMRDYVLVPDALFYDTAIIAPYLQESFEFVMSLPGK